jgi:excinuclease ABC subunit B
MDTIIRVELLGDRVERISEVDRVTGQPVDRWGSALIPPAKHYVIEEEVMRRAIESIKGELRGRARWFEDSGKPLEAERVRQRTDFDLELLEATGFCSGIENYSRYLTGREPGAPPYTLLDFFPEGFLTIIDESHVMLPQLHGMHNGDRSRKRALVDYGFRLPSAYDNRPLTYEEFEGRTGPTLYTSATPDRYELGISDLVVEQVVRPTGLLDPRLEVRPVKGQVDDLLAEVRARTARGERVLVTTLTKRMAEDLTDHYADLGVRVRYLHSDIETVERVELLRDLEAGEFDVLVGINLLREGLDLPPVSLVAIFDADKEGFLRSETALLQTIGRASRNINGAVIMYASRVTEAMRRVLEVTETRRAKQAAYNAAHGIEPATVVKARPIRPIAVRAPRDKPVAASDIQVDLTAGPEAVIDQLRREMDRAASDLEFEYAAAIRDKIAEIEESEMGIEHSEEAEAGAASRRAARGGKRRRGMPRQGGGASRRTRGRGGA